MKSSRTAVEVYSRRAYVQDRAGLRAVASLHSHSTYSREKLCFIPEVARRIPLVAPHFERGLAEFAKRYEQPLDFSLVYWRPPLSPAAVISSEREQAAHRFDLPVLASLTDHDTLEGPRSLRAMGHVDIPLSLEWSAPYEGSLFHLGVHGIAPDCVNEIERALAAHTARATGRLADLLSALSDSPETIIVLNHPFWDLARIGQLRHEANLLALLRRHGDWIHGLELNGYRTWTENRRVLSLASGFGLPLVGGGDRHGYVPNGIVNLTSAASWAGFAEELRVDRVSRCVVLPEYGAPWLCRILETASDVLRRDVRTGRTSWEDRVFANFHGVEEPLRALWRVPIWVRTTVAAVRALDSPVARAVLAFTRSDGARTLVADCNAEPLPQPASRSVPAEPSAAA